MKLIVDDELIKQYPDLNRRLEQLLIDSMKCRDAEGKLIHPSPIEIDISSTLDRLISNSLKDTKYDINNLEVGDN